MLQQIVDRADDRPRRSPGLSGKDGAPLGGES
jgi:hypothetical protein